MNMKIDFDMKEAKQVTINGTKGEGYAEIIHSGNKKECKGVASFSKEARAIKIVEANPSPIIAI